MLFVLGLNKQIAFHHDHFEFNDGSLPPHNFDLESRLSHYKKIDKLVYLERDPRDVMLSLYHQVTGRFKDFFHYQGDISTFIRDEYFGAKILYQFRNMWKIIAKECNFCTITYEECHANSRELIKKIIDYYECDIDDYLLDKAVQSGNIENMRKLEASNTFPEPWLRPRNASPKIRRGQIGGYKEALSDVDIKYLNLIFNIL